MKILVACEESQEVCKAFRAKGHEAYSCDMVPCSGGYPEWHFNCDVRPVLKIKWDMIIAHPPCTYLSRAGARWLHQNGGINKERYALGIKGKDFFMMFYNHTCPKVCIENPTPLKIFNLPLPSQAIHPYQFGHPFSKRTLLWLKGLPKLAPTNIIQEHTPYLPSNTGGAKRGQKHSRGVAKNATESSKTFPGIAAAMAEQWGSLK